jgi:hypothetical protein
MVGSKSSLSFILAMRLDKALLATMDQDGVGTLNGMAVAVGSGPGNPGEGSYQHTTVQVSVPPLHASGLKMPVLASWPSGTEPHPGSLRQPG